MDDRERQAAMTRTGEAALLAASRMRLAGDAEACGFKAQAEAHRRLADEHWARAVAAAESV